MKPITVMFILAILMQITVLTNVTLFDGAFDGLMMFITTGLFLGICAVYGSLNLNKQKK